VNLVR